MGYIIYATPSAHMYLAAQGVKSIALRKPSDLEIGLPSVIDYILPGNIELVMKVPDGINRDELTSGYMIHHAAVDFVVSLINNVKCALLFAHAIQNVKKFEICNIECLKLLKKNLSNYDGHHGNHFVNTATSYMRSDMRAAKDTSADLNHVAHQINKSPRPSESEVTSARNMMGATNKAMNVLKTTARNYDQKNGRSTGVKGVIDNVVGDNDYKDNETKCGGLFGKDSNDQDDNHTGLLGKSDKVKEKESKGVGSLFGRAITRRRSPSAEVSLARATRTRTTRTPGCMGARTRTRTPTTVVVSSEIRAAITTTTTMVAAASSAAPTVAKTTLRDNFNVSALSHQITIAEKSLSVSPSFVERAKEVVNKVKDKLKREKSSSPSRDGHYAHKRAVMP
ncbi:hypothetical protein PR003_g27065 [Phytophthora rubi]|uniref:MGS-like domain-containing protein n=1 Tax=Phytophthora rubi TaxID=129364 RepID=A0A6A4C4N1_9STRA|nr:hypothetical protein PR003_g27065 [Phytophthora rubi]